MPQTWFTSDTHLGHAAIIGHTERPFMDCHSMNLFITQTWRKLVSPHDTVYHLGDFFWGYNTRKAIDLINTLPGKIYWIVGNHDQVTPGNTKAKTIIAETNVKEIVYYKEITIQAGLESQTIVLFHYPMVTWNKKSYGSWHLHGHSHGNIPPTHHAMVDVGFDCANYFDPTNLLTAEKKRVSPLLSYDEVSEIVRIRQEYYKSSRDEMALAGNIGNREIV